MPLLWESKKKEKIKQKILKKKLFIFDFDRTMSFGKNPMAKEMELMFFNALCGWGNYNIAVKSRYKYEQMYEWFVEPIVKRSLRIDKQGSMLDKLYLLPVSGASLYRWDRDEKRFNSIYKETLSLMNKVGIVRSFYTAIPRVDIIPDKIYGEVEEDRGGQIVFSLCGHDAPPEEKIKFDHDGSKRLAIQHELVKRLPDFEVTVEGMTSINVSRKGINKNHNIKKLLKQLNVFKKDTMFVVGPSKTNKLPNIDCVSVESPAQTYEFLVFLAKEVLSRRSKREEGISNKKRIKRR